MVNPAGSKANSPQYVDPADSPTESLGDERTGSLLEVAGNSNPREMTIHPPLNQWGRTELGLQTLRIS